MISEQEILEDAAFVIPPFKLTPDYVERIWGTNDLSPWYGARGIQQPIGEIWLTGDNCLVSGGPLAGARLSSLFTRHGEIMLGRPVPISASSPLLLKVIFAKNKLSVQVHPDDEMAQRYGYERGKTECWYALDAEPGAQLACGIKPNTATETIRQGITDGTLEESLNIMSVEAGDMIYIDAGTVHAIWPGSILLETQQNSDLTYRMYDYGRPRELHIERSLEAIRLNTKAGKVKAIEKSDRVILIANEFFRIERLNTCTSISGEQLRVLRA